MSYSEASYTRAGGLYETEAQRLQREADEYTKKLEHERKWVNEMVFANVKM